MCSAHVLLYKLCIHLTVVLSLLFLYSFVIVTCSIKSIRSRNKRIYISEKHLLLGNGYRYPQKININFSKVNRFIYDFCKSYALNE